MAKRRRVRRRSRGLPLSGSRFGTVNTVKKRQIALAHPGEILLEDFLKPLGISQYRLAKDTKVPPRRINEIVKGLRGISTDTALRLAIYFDMSPEFWINLQSHYDLERLRQLKGEELEREIQPRGPEAA